MSRKEYDWNALGTQLLAAPSLEGLFANGKAAFDKLNASPEMAEYMKACAAIGTAMKVPESVGKGILKTALQLHRNGMQPYTAPVTTAPVTKERKSRKVPASDAMAAGFSDAQLQQIASVVVAVLDSRK